MKFSSEVEPDEQGAYIDTTSLVDVVFTLLIFFMASTTFVDTQGIDIKLPVATKNAPPADTENLSISIDAGDQIYLGAKRTSLSDLEKELAALQEQGKVGTVILRADQSVKHGSVVKIMDTIRQSGISKISVATTSEQ